MQIGSANFNKRAVCFYYGATTFEQPSDQIDFHKFFGVVLRLIFIRPDNWKIAPKCVASENRVRTDLFHRKSKMTTEDNADARDDVVDQPPKISRTSYPSYARHKTRLPTDFAS
jgi:hypothetical protein